MLEMFLNISHNFKANQGILGTFNMYVYISQILIIFEKGAKLQKQSNIWMFFH